MVRNWMLLLKWDKGDLVQQNKHGNLVCQISRINSIRHYFSVLSWKIFLVLHDYHSAISRKATSESAKPFAHSLLMLTLVVAALGSIGVLRTVRALLRCNIECHGSRGGRKSAREKYTSECFRVRLRCVNCTADAIQNLSQCSHERRLFCTSTEDITGMTRFSQRNNMQSVKARKL